MTVQKFTQGELFGQVKSPKQTGRLTDEEFCRIVDLYESGLTYDEMVKATGRSTPTLLRALKLSGVAMRGAGSGNRLHTVDHEFFSGSPNEIRNYMIGFIATDGCVTDDHRLSINLQDGDRPLLERFRTELACSSPVRTRMGETKNGTPFIQATFRIRSVRMVADLKHFGVTPRKSMTLRICGGVENCPHFWRGAIDGDGQLGLYGGAGRRSKRPRCNLCSASRAFIEQFKTFVDANVGPSTARVLQRNRTGNPLYDHIATCSRAAALCRLLYGECAIALPRKLALAEEIMRWDDPDAATARAANRIKIDESCVRRIREAYKAGGLRQIDLAERFGVSRSLVGFILQGKRRGNVGD